MIKKQRSDNIDITRIEREKRIITCLMHTMPIKIKSLDSEECYRYLLNHPDIDIVNLIKIIHKTANHLKTTHHKQAIKDIMNVGLAVCCRNDQYAEILSETLSAISGRKVAIKCHNGFNTLELAMFKIIMKITYKIAKQRMQYLDRIHAILTNCSDDAVNFVYAAGIHSMKTVLSKKEYISMLPFFELMLFILYTDTAYRDPFFWAFDKLARPELKNIIKPFVKPPHEWCINVWIDGQKITDEQIKKGIIPAYEHCVIGQRTIPSEQKYALNKSLRE